MTKILKFVIIKYQKNQQAEIMNVQLIRLVIAPPFPWKSTAKVVLSFQKRDVHFLFTFKQKEQTEALDSWVISNMGNTTRFLP